MADVNGELIQYLTQEKVNLTSATNEAASQTNIVIEDADLEKTLQDNAALLTLVQGKIENLNQFLAYQQKQQQNLVALLKKAQQTFLSHASETELQAKVNHIHILSEANFKTIELLNSNINLARQYQQLLLKEKQQLVNRKASIHERQAIQALDNDIQRLNQSRAQLYQANVLLQQEKISDHDIKNKLDEEAQLQLNNRRVILLQYQMSILELQKKQLKADNMLMQATDFKTCQIVMDTNKSVLNQLTDISDTLQSLRASLVLNQSLFRTPDLKKQFTTIQKELDQLIAKVTLLQQKWQQLLEDRQQQLKHQLSLRQNLAEYRLSGWPTIGQQLLTIPGKCYSYLKLLLIKISENYVWQDFWVFLLYWCCFGLIIAVALIVHYFLRDVVREKERSRLIAHVFDGVLALIFHNIAVLAFLVIVLMTYVFNHIPFSYYQMIVQLIVVWLIFRNLALIARLILLERISDVSGQDAKLYYRLKWLFMMGGLATAFMVISHQLSLSLLLQDMFNRLFMLFLLAVAGVFWKSRSFIPTLIRPLLRTRKRYFRTAISVFFVLVPLIIFTTAMIGLVGYIDLAWTMSRYQAYLLLLTTAYVLVRGLIFDALELLSEWMISALQNGWLWIEVILKPLDKIIRLCLVLFSIFLVFQLFGWYSDASVMSQLNQLEQFPLVDISGVHITLISTIEFFLLACIFSWAAKWTREFCYRWVFRHSRDAGIRHSLSVFVQYAVVVLGVFITLRVLGLDFSGMSMVLGGLAVGMGFGLRDFASNIVGGVMLLIERPVREGDLVTIGDYEGRVAHIGIRSMRVSSWDNMEVLVPNAETFNKPFTNWTHQDSIVRTVIPIKVSRSDDPVLVQRLLLDVLEIIPEILNNPSPQVLLTQIDEALIALEVRYFINVQLYTRFEIRSKVLFAITAQFKAAGIKAPVPPFEVEFKEGASLNADPKATDQK